MPELFSSDGFMPHGHCYLWEPGLVWLHLISDLLIALAYTTIPFTLVYFIRRRRDVPYRSIFLWFGLFIVSCGATHLFEAWNLYHAHYWLAGLAKAFTAVASLATAFLLVRIVPEAITLPSREDLRRAHDGLRESEEALSQSQRWQRALFENALDAMFVIDDEGRYLDANPAATDLVGYTRDELLSLTNKDLTPLPGREGHFETWRAFREGGTYSSEYSLLRKDGSVCEAEFRAVANGLPGVHFAIARDVTARKRMEEERERLVGRLLQVQEEERRALARDLHDEVGQLLTGLRLMIENADAMGAADRPEMKRVVNEVIGRVRDISMSLRPPMLDELGVLPTLFWQIERFENQTDIAVEFRHANMDRRLPQEIELAAFRVVQEALTNVAKHAQVTRVRVEVWTTSQTLGARIEDEGRGFDLESALAGPTSGLSGIRERCRLLEGSLRIESKPGTGTQLLVELPLAGRPKAATP